MNDYQYQLTIWGASARAALRHAATSVRRRVALSDYVAGVRGPVAVRPAPARRPARGLRRSPLKNKRMLDGSGRRSIRQGMFMFWPAGNGKTCTGTREPRRLASISGFPGDRDRRRDHPATIRSTPRRPRWLEKRDTSPPKIDKRWVRIRRPSSLPAELSVCPGGTINRRRWISEARR